MRRRGLTSSTATLDAATRLLVDASADPRCFGAFYRDRHAAVFGFVRRQVLCPEIAADITAEAFVEALLHIERFDPRRASANAWMRGIASNQIRMWARSGAVDARARTRLGIVTPSFTEEDYAMIDRREDELELLDTVRRVLAELSEPDRNVISLRLLEGLDYDEIAAELQCTAPAARVRASRALAKLRSGFDADLEANQHRPSESDELGEAAR